MVPQIKLFDKDFGQSHGGHCQNSADHPKDRTHGEEEKQNNNRMQIYSPAKDEGDQQISFDLVNK
jgi:hypothetical protein